MSSIFKVTLASVMAYTAMGKKDGGSLFDRLRSRQGPAVAKSPFDDEEAFFLGKCLVRDVETDRKIGKVLFHQLVSDEGELEPTSMSAMVRGLTADRIAVEAYETDPATNDNEADAVVLAELRPNVGDRLSLFGLFVDDLTLQGDDSLEGAFIGIRCAESRRLVGSCQIQVLEKGDHGDDGEDGDE
eukprot:CAMPEP_0185600266 /NCGR_PEP_ID=MMETSP0436-20130131/271_1 /TAXON_ID=626734 ORGANISM="Favella taraikaensis, Strain Fe Narragansett Bay" /NCGR_SAMPLE_ID=MMETSP0436 /ASSEMBLY_ACC=CAM_ASM_000390 /LENGTH=185 /DNA_ID=CAMNT_0028229929 /DNA_START=28 /DNA_END=585 /DNA_ORIENTATION=+